MNKTLLIGRGHLGSFLKDRLQIAPDYHWTRDMAELTVAELTRLQPTSVINTAGKTDLRWCEDNANECFRCNVAAPLEVYRNIKEALGESARYIHLSSGCVWDGPYRKDGKPFQPDDPPVPACFYAWTKAVLDQMILAEAKKTPVMLLRPRQVYSPMPSARNTLSKLRSYANLLDTPNSMTSSETIAKTIECALALESRLTAHPKPWNRIVNVYELGHSSPFEVGTLLAEAGLRAAPGRLTKSELDVWHKPKRVDAVIQDSFFEWLVDPPTVQDELKRNIAEYARLDKPLH